MTTKTATIVTLTCQTIMETMAAAPGTLFLVLFYMFSTNDSLQIGYYVYKSEWQQEPETQAQVQGFFFPFDLTMKTTAPLYSSMEGFS